MNKEIYKAPIRRLMKVKISAGALLIFSALSAMVIVNSAWGPIYEDILSRKISFHFFGIDVLQHNGVDMTLATFINDIFMTIFFLSVGLEIKREVLTGELSSWRKALLPVVAACGGMLIPVLIFLLMAPEGIAQIGAAIPMATDIAFSLAILALLGKRVPIALKIFLTALAVVDDLGGIIVIAVFYSSHILFSHIIAALVILVLMYLGGKAGIVSKLFYIFGFFTIWGLLFHSGIHPTVAGVLSALAIPARPRLNLTEFINDIQSSVAALPQNQVRKRMLNNSELSTLKHIESVSDRAISPLQSLDDNLAPIVNYLILPLFAFANAGISFEGFSLTSIGGVSIAVFCGLLFGKTIGIFTFSWAAIKSGWLKMPKRLNYKMLFGVSILGGIGFTVSLFIASLSYTGAESLQLLNDAKLGIILGSLFAAICGFLVLKFVLKHKKTETLHST